jgi:hypothetical protein
MSELHGGGGHKEMHWPIDEPTRLAARNFPLHIAARQPAKQDLGKKYHPSGWQNCLRRSDEFSKAPAGVYANTPSQIISEFRQKHYPKKPLAQCPRQNPATFQVERSLLRHWMSTVPTRSL